MRLPTRNRLFALWSAAAVLTVSATAQPSVVTEEAFPGVTFRSPVGVETLVRDGGEQFYVLEQGSNNSQPSRIMTLRATDAGATVFLDISDRTRAGGEAGLLGLAFHPDYQTNGRLFVSYTAPVDSPREGVRVLESRISEFARSAANPLVADPESERVLLRLDQPADNHNGGTVDFGPDGYLYAGFGDGGGGGDPFGTGQDPTTLLGTIIRIDVDDVPEDEPYGIPPDNPFASSDNGERPEIYAIGFRNPFKLDASAAGLWVGDVGQDRWEEVDLVERGGNYGWSEVEGPVCYRSGCDLNAYDGPVHSYNRSAGESITGGVVVESPGTSLDGHYLFGDFVSGRLWSLDVADPTAPPTLLFRTVPNGSGGQRQLFISSIDPGPLVTDYVGGRVYRLVASPTGGEGRPASSALAVALAGPNPTPDHTALAVSADGPVEVDLLDALGRTVGHLWSGPAPSGRVPVDVSGLAPGVYTAQARTANGVASVRIVVAR